MEMLKKLLKEYFDYVNTDVYLTVRDENISLVNFIRKLV